MAAKCNRFFSYFIVVVVVVVTFLISFSTHSYIEYTEYVFLLSLIKITKDFNVSFVLLYVFDVLILQAAIHKIEMIHQKNFYYYFVIRLNDRTPIETNTM